jgi:transposase
MPRSQKLSQDLRRRIIEMHKAGKCSKSIAKDLGVHQSTVRQIVYKWRRFRTVAPLPGSGRPVKITPRAQRTILKEVRKNPRVTAKYLQKTLQTTKVCVHVSTIRKTLNNNGVDGRIPRRKPLLSKKKHCGTSQVFPRPPGCSTTPLGKCTVDR